MISIQDLLETNLLDNIQAITALDLVITIALAFGMGMFILFIYGRIYQGAMYSGSFAVSLVALTMISTTLILAVTSNLVLSLGMMGALSIVRFRTAIKDPLEIVFLFWAIETGIVLATGILPLAVIVNIVIGCLLLVLVVRRPDYPYILVLKCEKHALKKVGEVLEKHVHYTVKSRKVETRPRAVQGRGQKPESIQDTGVPAGSTTPESEDRTIVELDIEVTLKNTLRKHNSPAFDETEFVDKLAQISGVSKAILVTYNGAYMA